MSHVSDYKNTCPKVNLFSYITHVRPSSNVPPYEGSATLMAKPVTRILRGSYLDFLPQGVSSTVDRRHGWPGCVFLYGSCPDGGEERPAVSFDPK